MLRFILITIFLLTRVCIMAQDAENRISRFATDAQRSDTLLSLARDYFSKARFDSAVYWLDKGMVYAKKSGNPATLAASHILRSSLYAIQGKFRSSIPHLKEASSLADEVNNSELKTKALVQLAVCYNGLNKKDSAIYFYRQAEMHNKEKNPYANWIVYAGLGELYSYMDDIGEAEKYYIKAYTITANKNNSNTYRDYLLNHGYVLTMFINFHIVWKKPAGLAMLLHEYDELMEERKTKEVDEPFQVLLANRISSGLGKDIGFLQSIRDNSIASGNNNQVLIANEYIIRYYEKREQWEEALKYANENEALAPVTGSVQNVFFSKQLKYQLLKSLHRFDEASMLADTLFELKDSILGLQRREQIYELEKKYESEKNQKEIELLVSQNALDDKTIALLQSDKKMTALLLQQEILMRSSLATENLLKDSIVKNEKAYSLSVFNEKEQQRELNNALDRENKLKAAQLNRERIAKWILGGGVTLLLLSGIFILSLYRKQKKKNTIIQKQSQDLEVLMKEIHHRVKNNLQIVSSLLDLQRLTITDTQASEAVKEGQNRVQSMALIHQNLYAEGNIKAIQVKEYVTSLLENLCNSYSITRDKVKISTEVDPLNLDIDTMIPLGLVLNELVTNSLKYAFSGQQEGRLSVIIKEESDHLLLKVSDNGQGYPEELNIQNSKSFGMKMIRAFAQKLKAQLNIYNAGGAVTEMRITKYELV